MEAIRRKEYLCEDEDLFYLTEPMEEGYVPKVKFFYEHSSYGVLETTVKFVESR